jgi:hypothetical protein
VPIICSMMPRTFSKKPVIIKPLLSVHDDDEKELDSCHKIWKPRT